MEATKDIYSTLNFLECLFSSPNEDAMSNPLSVKPAGVQRCREMFRYKINDLAERHDLKSRFCYSFSFSSSLLFFSREEKKGKE